MKAILKTPQLTIELDATSPKDLFKKVAETQEVFAERSCGMCGCEDIQFRVRTVNGDDYYENVCTKCGATLSFGQSKKTPGALFPIRKLTAAGKPSRKEGTYDAKHRGWTKFRGDASNAPNDSHDDEEPAKPSKK